MRIGIDAHHLNGKPQGSRTHLIELIRALGRLVGDDDELRIYSFAPNEDSVGGLLEEEEFETERLDQSSRDFLDAAIHARYHGGVRHPL